MDDMSRELGEVFSEQNVEDDLGSEDEVQKRLDDIAEGDKNALLLKAYQYLTKRTYPSVCRRHEKKSIRRKASRLLLKGDKIYYKTNGKILRYIVDCDERLRIYNSCHVTDYRHYGAKKTLSLITCHYIWPGVTKDVRNWVDNCENCPVGIVIRKPNPTLPQPKLQHVVASSPWQHLSLDFLGPVNPSSRQGNCYILTILDYFSKYAQAVPLNSKDAYTAASALHKVFMKFGIPKAISSDIGKKFNNDFDAEMKKLLHIDYPITALYHPKGDGHIGQFRQTLQGCIVKCVADMLDSWEDYLDPCIYNYNTLKHESAQFTPFEMHFGRTSVIPADQLTDFNTEPEFENSSMLLEDTSPNNKHVRHKHRVGTMVLKKDLANKIRCGGRLTYMWQGPFRVTHSYGRDLYGLESVKDPNYVVNRVKGIHLKAYHLPFHRFFENTSVAFTITNKKPDAVPFLKQEKDSADYDGRVNGMLIQGKAKTYPISYSREDPTPVIKIERTDSSYLPQITIEAPESAECMPSAIVVKGRNISPLEEVVEKATIEIHSTKDLDAPDGRGIELQWDVMNIVNEENLAAQDKIEPMDEEDENALVEKAVQYLLDKSYPESCSRQDKRSVRRKAQRLVTSEGQIYYKKRNGSYVRYIMDPEERAQILSSCHVNGTTHMGIKRTLAHVTEQFIWHGVSNDVHVWVESCQNCPRRGKRRKVNPTTSKHQVNKKPLDF
ncbi:uncharacterized protein LOC143039042 [Oratosquilla oratoria]|uniref:uncharacterized protein LOC143039042 n=1 Tax=Oratosquilla oratoria TaxID=337810 RepID=UPI003F770875